MSRDVPDVDLSPELMMVQGTWLLSDVHQVLQCTGTATLCLRWLPVMSMATTTTGRASSGLLYLVPGHISC